METILLRHLFLGKALYEKFKSFSEDDTEDEVDDGETTIDFDDCGHESSHFGYDGLEVDTDISYYEDSSYDMKQTIKLDCNNINKDKITIKTDFADTSFSVSVIFK